MAKTYAKIIGWGHYAPQKVVTNHDLAERIDTSHEWIVERTGIHARHIAAEGEHTSHMAYKAAVEALKKANLSATDLDLIIVATSSPDYLTPPVSSQVQDMLGAKNVGAFTMVVGCPGFVAALITADQFIRAGGSKNILVVGVELLSRNLNWEDRNTCVLFGDGAGAVVMTSTEQESGVLSYVMGSDGSGAQFLIQRSGGVAYPQSEKSLELGYNFLEMDGKEVFKFASRILGKAVIEAAEKINLPLDKIDLFIPHQANARIIESAARQIGLPKEKVFLNIENYGNTSAGSVPIALSEAMASGRAKPGDIVAFVAFGAGLTWASAIVKL